MLDEAQHVAQVDAWIERTAHGASSEAQVKLFEAALAVLWTRTRITLGDVTLSAIADRVLSNAIEQFPAFSVLTVDSATGIQCSALLAHADGMQRAELTEGIRFVLVEFLTVLGHLTAEILTPELHAELSRVGTTEAASSGKGARVHGTDSAKAGRQDGES